MINRILLTLALTIVVSNFGFSQKVHSTPIKPFDKIVAIGNVEIILNKSKSTSIKMLSDQIDVSKVSVDFKNTTMKIKLLDVSGNNAVRIEVPYIVIREVSAKAGAIINCNKLISGDVMKVSAESGSKVNLNLKMNAVTASAGKGAFVELLGDTQVLTCSANTGGEVNAYKLNSDVVYAKSGSGATVKVNAKNLLEAKANTKGLVKYTGNPKERREEIVLGGLVLKKEE